VLAALVLSSPEPHRWPAAGLWLLATLAATLAYAGGTTLNDVADVEFDRRHRPERAIPSQVVTRRTAAWVGGLQLLAALALFGGLGASWGWSGALIATIL